MVSGETLFLNTINNALCFSGSADYMRERGVRWSMNVKKGTLTFFQGSRVLVVSEKDVRSKVAVTTPRLVFEMRCDRERENKDVRLRIIEAVTRFAEETWGYSVHRGPIGIEDEDAIAITVPEEDAEAFTSEVNAMFLPFGYSVFVASGDEEDISDERLEELEEYFGKAWMAP